SGVLQAQLRGDGAGVHTIDSSRRKAYTAASMGRPTQVFAELVSKHPDLHALGDMNGSILLLGGGFPIRIDGQIVGGIGVGGAPGAHFDESCARAGLKALGADLYQ
ncbi:MAG: heme-binding protein, partial [Mariprofundaceae bacterium]|nr:heme-binding protein [Mariprofundaceae bacterium]